MSLTSSILNSVQFKAVGVGTLPTKWNTLHENFKQGSFFILNYCQRFNKGDVVKLQFVSDTATAPSLKSYIPSLNETLAPSATSSYVGDDSRYFFNFEVTLGATYYDKYISFTITQGSDVLTSEPIKCESLTEDLANGWIKKVRYTNADRGESDLPNYVVDWSILTDMFFYVEAVLRKPKNQSKNEVLEGSQSKTMIASNTFSGNIFETGGIPDYLSLKLIAAAGLDVFEVNEIQYICEGFNEDNFGSSTSMQLTLDLVEKNTIGLNVDDLGITVTDTEMPIVNKRNTGVTGSGWTVENPLGYHVHAVWMKHAATSAATVAEVTLGTTIGGGELIDSEMGSIVKAEYSTTWQSFPQHFLKNPAATSNLYFSVSGAGAIMDILVQFETVIETT